MLGFRKSKNAANIRNIDELKSIDYLDKQNLLTNLPTIDKLKANLRLLIIDDEDFEYLDTLKNHGYRIDQIKEIVAIEQVDNYDIVLCDIKGIGRKFTTNDDNGGADVIKLIKEKYPNKYVILYSGEIHEVKLHKFFALADDQIQKDYINERALRDIINEAMKDYSKPSFQWKQFEKFLKNNSIANKEITLIEDHYVNVIIGEEDVHNVKDDFSLELGFKAFQILITTITALIELS